MCTWVAPFNKWHLLIKKNYLLLKYYVQEFDQTNVIDIYAKTKNL